MTSLYHETGPDETMQVPVRDVMTPDPVTVSPRTSVDEAQKLMQNHRVGHLPVCEDERLVGLVSEWDLRLFLPSPATSLSGHELHYLLEKLTVAEVMAQFPVTIGPNQPLLEAVRRMLSHKVEALPVTENRRVVGMLTRTNLLYAFVRSQSVQPVAA